MKKICLILEMHQPIRLNTYRFSEITNNHYYYNDYENEFHIRKISGESYMPVNRILHDLIHYSKGDFKVSFLFSGIIMDLFELYVPEILESYKDLLDTGCVELISGTYSNSFGPLISGAESNSQIKLQNKRMQSIFSKKPLPSPVRDHFNYHYRITSPGIVIIPGEERQGSPIKERLEVNHLYDLSSAPEKLVKLLYADGNKDQDIIIFLPFDLFGDNRHSLEILLLLEQFPVKILSKSGFAFVTPPEMEAVSTTEIKMTGIPDNAVTNSDVFYSKCNDLQVNAFEKLYSISEKIRECDDPYINRDWLNLQACDHFYFMNPVFYEKSELHETSVPYSSHFFAYINYMNILADLFYRLEEKSDRTGKEPVDLSHKNRGFNRADRYPDLSWNKKKNSGNRPVKVKTLVQ